MLTQQMFQDRCFYTTYCCPIRVLNIIKHQIAWPLAEIMNISIEKGVFASKLKHAKTIPIFKR